MYIYIYQNQGQAAIIQSTRGDLKDAILLTDFSLYLLFSSRSYQDE